MTQHESPGGLNELAEMLLRVERQNQAAATANPEDQGKRQRRRRNRRIVGGVATLVVIALVAGYAYLTLTAPLGVAAVAVSRPDVAAPPAVTIALPTVGEAAVSVDGADDYLGAKAGGILASSGNSPLPMASISKIITALVVLNAKPLGATAAGPTITFDKADAALYDKYYVLNATIAAMPANSSMSEYDAIETMLVVSACNYAEALDDWAFGSVPAAMSATRTWLRTHSLTGTTMVEPTGLDAGNKSTPSDLITIGKLAMANPAIASIVAKKTLDVPSLPSMPNTNDLLGVDGIDGIKTGTLETAGSDLLFSATATVGTPKALTITGVVLGGENHASVDTTVRDLIASVLSGFHTVQLGNQGQVVGTYSTAWGAKAKMVLDKDASVLTWSNTPVTSTITTTTLKTGSRGEKVGQVTWVAGKSTVTAPVILAGRIVAPTAWWRLTHPAQLLGKWWP